MQAINLSLCKQLLWQWDGIYEWLLGAAHHPVTAVAQYDAGLALKLLLCFGRHGICTTHCKVAHDPDEEATVRQLIETCVNLHVTTDHAISERIVSVADRGCRNCKLHRDAVMRHLPCSTQRAHWHLECRVRMVGCPAL